MKSAAGMPDQRDLDLGAYTGYARGGVVRDPDRACLGLFQTAPITVNAKVIYLDQGAVAAEALAYLREKYAQSGLPAVWKGWAGSPFPEAVVGVEARTERWSGYA